jgi:hypothetical protein
LDEAFFEYRRQDLDGQGRRDKEGKTCDPPALVYHSRKANLFLAEIPQQLCFAL